MDDYAIVKTKTGPLAKIHLKTKSNKSNTKTASSELLKPLHENLFTLHPKFQNISNFSLKFILLQNGIQNNQFASQQKLDPFFFLSKDIY